jgi:malate dehydrogenase (oxaloacetate-decarboxylating)
VADDELSADYVIPSALNKTVADVVAKAVADIVVRDRS